MEDYNHLLLSICIPTYNRAEYLRGALENITSDPAFDDRVEIIISDNASEDNTEEIGKEYARKYANIKYFRNEKNIRDANFKLSFERASGKYLKLFNDTLRFKENSLSTILDILSNTADDEAPLFVQNNEFASNTEAIVNSPDELVSKFSFYTTWIVNLGIPNDKISVLNIDRKYTEYQLAQVAWLLKLASISKIKIHFGDWYESIWPKNKGGYNLFKVFISNYFSILNDFNIKDRNIRVEKRRLFKYFLVGHIISRLIFGEKERFKTDGAWKILWKYYGKEPYAYINFTASLSYRIGQKLLNILIPNH